MTGDKKPLDIDQILVGCQYGFHVDRRGKKTSVIPYTDGTVALGRRQEAKALIQALLTDLQPSDPETNTRPSKAHHEGDN